MITLFLFLLFFKLASTKKCAKKIAHRHSKHLLRYMYKHQKCSQRGPNIYQFLSPTKIWLTVLTPVTLYTCITVAPTGTVVMVTRFAIATITTGQCTFQTIGHFVTYWIYIYKDNFSQCLANSKYMYNQCIYMKCEFTKSCCMCFINKNI